MAEMEWWLIEGKNMSLKVAQQVEMVVMAGMVVLTLMDFRYNRHFQAERGENGMNKGKHGKDAEPLVVFVPPGTTVIDDDTNEVIADLTAHNQQALIARGGRGGRGNIKFASSRNPA